MKKKEDKNKDLDVPAPGSGQPARTCSSPATRRLKVSQDFELRKVVRGAGGKYRVIKNNLARDGVAKARRPSRC